MRRWLPVLFLTLLLAGCSTGKKTASLPAPADPAAPATPAAVVPAPAAPAPADGLKGVITPAPAGELERVKLKAGATVDRAGIYFLNPATGEVDGFAGAEASGYVASDDNRWVVVPAKQGSYLADRQSGAIYRLEQKETRLVAARGNVLLLLAGGRYWVSAEGAAPERFRPVDGASVTTSPTAPVAVVAPDGRTLILADGTTVYLVESGSGAARTIGTTKPPAEGWQLSGLTAAPGKQGDEVVVRMLFYHDGLRLTRIQRYVPGTGEPLVGMLVQGEGLLAPNTTMAQLESVFGLTDALTIGVLKPSPHPRLTGASRCGAPFEGPYWLADSSGLVVATGQGPRLLTLDGTLAPAPGTPKSRWDGIPVPAPDRADRFALGSTRVVDGSGKLVAEAVVVRSIVTGEVSPWGERSDELRFIIRLTGGRGFSCQPAIFPPVVEKGPLLPTITGLQVKVAQGDCVNIRQSYSKAAKVIACLPGGTRLTPAEPPGRLDKGELQRPGNPYPTGMDSDYWWYVRTESGQKGWLFLDDEYLTWAVVGPGEAVPDLLASRISDRTGNLRWWLQVALGEQECGPNCSDGGGIGYTVRGLIGQCEQEPPAGLRLDPSFKTSRHEAGVALLEGGCQELLAARQSLGQPTAGPEWSARLKQLLARLPAPAH